MKKVDLQIPVESSYHGSVILGLMLRRIVWWCVLGAAVLLAAGIVVPTCRNCARLEGGPALAHVRAFREACGPGCCPAVVKRFNERKVYTGLWSRLMDKDSRVYVGDTSRDGVCSYVVNFHGRFPCHDFGMLWDSLRPDELKCERCGAGELFEAAGFKVSYSR